MERPDARHRTMWQCRARHFAWRPPIPIPQLSSRACMQYGSITSTIPALALYPGRPPATADDGGWWKGQASRLASSRLLPGTGAALGWVGFTNSPSLTIKQRAYRILLPFHEVPSQIERNCANEIMHLHIILHVPVTLSVCIQKLLYHIFKLFCFPLLSTVKHTEIIFANSILRDFCTNKHTSSDNEGVLLL